jgi:hypothetical protein
VSIVISSALSLSLLEEPNANNPIIGYHNLVTPTNVTATSEDMEYPAVNVANPSTNLRWLGVQDSPPDDIYLRFDINTNEQIDYVGIARHNLSSASIPVSIEGLTVADSPEDWNELVQDVILPNDGPAIFRFTPQALSAIRIRMQPGNEAPTIAVVYVGKLLVLPRRIYVGHTPMQYNRQATVVNGRSESGNFLGRIVLNETLSLNVEMSNIDPDFYREEIDPFFVAAVEAPFFWGWRPGDYPYESGFAWMTADSKMSNQRPNGFVQISFQAEGIAE